MDPALDWAAAASDGEPRRAGRQRGEPCRRSRDVKGRRRGRCRLARRPGRGGGRSAWCSGWLGHSLGG
jgi:hypothetical protein